MNDRMKDLVCPMCGSDDLEPSFDGDSMRCDRCEKWMPLDETETRAEYLAGNDDDPRDDPVVDEYLAVERAVGAEVEHD